VGGPAVIGRRSDSQSTELVSVVLSVENVPLFASLENFLFLRGDLFADFGVGFFLVTQGRGENLDNLLADGVAVFNEFNFVAGDQHIGNLVREADDFFASESHLDRVPLA
jgi:hypothetical protein